jgi:hypothetical protein
MTTTATKTKAPEFPGEAIGKFLDRYMIFAEEEQRTAAILWIIHTHAVEAAYTTPYLYIHSAEKRSGKTRLLEVLEALTHNPALAGNVTASTLYRTIESQRPTLLIDEVDTIFTGAQNEDLRSILNSGYKSNGVAWRTVPGKDGGETKAFSTFCPKALAGIDNSAMPDTIRDRCIPFTLKRKTEAQTVERFQYRKVQEEAEVLQAQVKEWVMANMDHLLDAEPKPIEGIGDRQWDIAEPLVAIAERGKGWAPVARKALQTLLAPVEEKDTIGVAILRAAKEIHDTTGKAKIFSEELATAMDMSAKRVGLELARYGITPRSVRHGGQIKKGYHAVDFREDWDRYL